MSAKRPYTLKIDPELLEALREIKTRDGVAESEQIRRGIQLWLKSKGYTAQRAERQRADTRKRSPDVQRASRRRAHVRSVICRHIATSIGECCG